MRGAKQAVVVGVQSIFDWLPYGPVIASGFHFGVQIHADVDEPLISGGYGVCHTAIVVADQHVQLGCHKGVEHDEAHIPAALHVHDVDSFFLREGHPTDFYFVYRPGLRVVLPVAGRARAG